ncbi:MAG TPA: hypothetical protein VH740_09130 [Vicinamibacterales bacterium]|jgi:hypothetical protein
MTARSAAAIVSLGLLAGSGACTSFYEIPIETPIQPKMDVSMFQRVLIAGFIGGGTDDVDANVETVRLLRSQLRSKSSLRVIDAEALHLTELAKDQVKTDPPPTPGGAADGQQVVPPLPPPTQAAENDPVKIRNEKDLEKYQSIFSDVAFWKKVGEEYQGPLIITGTVLFSPLATAGYVPVEREFFDQLGRRRVIQQRMYQERKGFTLQPKLIYIDGRTGATLYSETLREEILYPAQTNTPALSSYFELMDKLIPSFLNTLSMQKIRGTRVLVK